MLIHLNIADEYFAYLPIYSLLNKLGDYKIIVCDSLNEEHLLEFRDKVKFEIIKKGDLYNVVRNDVDLVIIGTDGEDKHSIYMCKYCINHRIPVVLFTNLLDEVL